MKLKTNKRTRKNIRRKNTRVLLKHKRATIRGGTPYACKGPSQDDPDKQIDKDGCETALYDEFARLSNNIIELTESNSKEMQKLSGTILERSFLEYQKNIEIKLNEFKQSVGEEVLKPYLDSILTSENYNAFSSILNETRKRIQNDKRLSDKFKLKNVALLTNAIKEVKSITIPTKSKNKPPFVVRHIGGERQYYHNINKNLNITELLYNNKYYVNPIRRFS